LPLAASLLLILGAHELGHYFAARHHKIAVTLPYFIPNPFSMLIGTLGAFIQLRQPMKNRKALFDVGAAGPLAGLLFAIPILFIGLATSQLHPLTPGQTYGYEGDSLLYALAKTIVFGRFVPDGQYDVMVMGNPLTWAGWVGLLVTSINLIPIGQLDGGHVLYSLIGENARRLYYPVLLCVGGLVLLAPQMWLIWALLLLFFGRVYATPLDMITPLDKRRRWLAIFTLLLFVVIFNPMPLSQTYTVPALPDGPTQAVQWIAPALVGISLVWQRWRR
jgi:membrane-associated protease RseP (regulator of RpoE activity)